MVATQRLTFQDCSPALQAKLLEKYRDINVDDEYWAEHTIINCAEDLIENYGFGVKGYPILKDGRRVGRAHIHYSVSSSQGDGAMIEGGVEDWGKFLRALRTEEYTAIPDCIIDKVDGDSYELDWTAYHQGWYNHSRCSELRYEVTSYIEVESELLKAVYGVYDRALEALEKEIETWYHATCNRLYRQLEDEYDYLTSDAAIIYTLNANEFDFSDEYDPDDE